METSFEEELERSGHIAYTNVGISMLPLLRENRDVMRIEKKPWKLYDAVLFRRPGVTGRGRYIIHRIMRVNRDGSCWIVGDNLTEGETVQPEDILGVLTGVYRNGRMVELDDMKYRLYVTLWCKPWPFRFAVLRTKRICSGVLSRGKRAVKKLIGNSPDLKE